MVAPTQPVILFDGVCNLCSESVQFVLRHEKDPRFLFASQQSEQGQVLMAEHVLPAMRDLNAVILLQDGRAYYKSTAALRILWQLKCPWPVFAIFLIFPRFIRDFAYDFIGQRRYKWFGKKESCWVPDQAIKDRFLDMSD